MKMKIKIKIPGLLMILIYCRMKSGWNSFNFDVFRTFLMPRKRLCIFSINVSFPLLLRQYEVK